MSSYKTFDELTKLERESFLKKARTDKALMRSLKDINDLESVEEVTNSDIEIFYTDNQILLQGDAEWKKLKNTG